jgi:hypothetical protein
MLSQKKKKAVGIYINLERGQKITQYIIHYKQFYTLEKESVLYFQPYQ